MSEKHLLAQMWYGEPEAPGPAQVPLHFLSSLGEWPTGLWRRPSTGTPSGLLCREQKETRMSDDDDADVYYCRPFDEPHAVFRAFLLAYPDARVDWTTTDEGESDIVFEDEHTERCFRQWHHAAQEAAIVSTRGTLWMHAVLEPLGWPPV